ncbi:unnamed protein product [Paramecium pentaurelia]|uniref:Uncharacterized protein n=1 Tax=Paramecium pentaurelia TaxID=43138 RepID=A0A8S1YH06_9CILI|nr:unnamed protein product [Paramecium pentaurelia]
MVCRHPNCNNKGAICCRCQLKYHCDNGHTLESFVPLDEVLILCQTQNPKAEYFEDLSVDGILEVQQLQSTLSNINNSIQEQLKRELLILGQYQKPFKDIYGIIAHYSQIDGDISRTDDGTQGGMKSDFLNIMQYIANKIIIVDGEFTIDQSDMNNCLTEIIERKRKNLNILQKLNKKSQKQAKIISALFQTGCSFGLDQHIPISQFDSWVQIYNAQYFENTTYQDIISLVIPQNSLIMVGILKEKYLEFCAIDRYKAIFKGKINSYSKLNWTLNQVIFGCECLKWNLNQQLLDQQIDQKEYLYHLNDRRVIYYLEI